MSKSLDDLLVHLAAVVGLSAAETGEKSVTTQLLTCLYEVMRDDVPKITPEFRDEHQARIHILRFWSRELRMIARDAEKAGNWRLASEVKDARARIMVPSR